MGEFRIDEYVDITIKRVRITRPHMATSVTIVDEHGLVYQMPPQAAVTRAEPEFWPPAEGDVWRDGEGRLWFAQQWPSGLRMVPAVLGDKNALEACPPVYLLDRCGPLSRVWGEVPF